MEQLMDPATFVGRAPQQVPVHPNFNTEDFYQKYKRIVKVVCSEIVAKHT